jgi:hypothetical protein
MGVAKKNGDRFYDFVDSEVQCLFYKNRRAENTQIPSPVPGYILWVSINQVTYIAPQIREKIYIQGCFTSVILQ